MALNPALAGAIHDLQARLGSIRIAVSAVVGLDLDAETRTEMLTSASDESVRASAELMGIGALAACALDASATEQCDLAAALRDATDSARLAGLDIAASVGGPALVDGRAQCLDIALPALIRLVAGAGKEVDASVQHDGDEVCVRLDRRGANADQEALPPVVDYLIEAIGGKRVEDAAVLAFSLPQVVR